MADRDEASQVHRESKEESARVKRQFHPLPACLIQAHLSPFTGILTSVRIHYYIHVLWHISSQVAAMLPQWKLLPLTTEVKLIYRSKYKKGSSPRPLLGKEEWSNANLLMFNNSFYTFILSLCLHCSLVCIADMLLFTALRR